MAETSSDRSIFGNAEVGSRGACGAGPATAAMIKTSVSLALHGLSMLVMSGLLACGISRTHGNAQPIARHVAIDVASSSVADSARVSIKLALASRDVRQLCKLVMAEQGVKLTWAEGDSESRAQHGLTALRHCAAMILQDGPFSSPERSPETC